MPAVTHSTLTLRNLSTLVLVQRTCAGPQSGVATVCTHGSVPFE